MKALIFCLLIPVFCSSQTIHLQKDKIEYKEKIKTESLSQDEIFSRAKNAVLQYVKGSDSTIQADAANGSIVANGHFKLRTPHSIVDIVHYTIKLETDKKGYKYTIDDVYLLHANRGEKPEYFSSEKLVKDLEVSGPTSIKTEKQLDEMDMIFQKLIVLIRNKILNNTN